MLKSRHFLTICFFDRNSQIPVYIPVEFFSLDIQSFFSQGGNLLNKKAFPMIQLSVKNFLQLKSVKATSLYIS